ncbi:MAG: 4Fe-4S binding protein [Deltaproteobacteria bacterium]|nr:4Fe-4S binding protein [Deltaproteobacteria bacterium]
MSVYIDENLCKSCKMCVKFCPKDVFALSGKVNNKGYEYMAAVREADCIACRLCEKTCPDLAIYVEKD